MSDFDLLRQVLQPGERLIWSGRPRGGVSLPVGGVWGLIVAATVVGLLLLGALLAVGVIAGGNVFGGLIVLTFVSFIAYSVVIERLIDQFRRRSVTYGLTDRRAIVIDETGPANVRSVPLATLTEIQLTEHFDRFGTIRCIGTSIGWFRKNRRGETKPVPLFRQIVDARHVHDLLLKAKRDLFPAQDARSV